MRPAPAPPPSVRRLLAGAVVLACALAACSPAPIPFTSQPERPDWIEINQRPRLVAQVWTDPTQLPAPLFAPLEDRPRLLVYPYPQVRELAVPPDGQVRDVAFFDVGGRAIEAYPRITCPGPAPCQPLSSRFPAAWVLIAPPGTFSQWGLARHARLRWGKPSEPAASMPFAMDGSPGATAASAGLE